jgi:hypothetical protein
VPKAIMMLMDKLDAAAAVNGASVDIYWFYEDDTMQELGGVRRT